MKASELNANEDMERGHLHLVQRVKELERDIKRKPVGRWEPGDGWGVIAMACLPVLLVGAGYLVVQLFKWAAK